MDHYIINEDFIIDHLKKFRIVLSSQTHLNPRCPIHLLSTLIYKKHTVKCHRSLKNISVNNITNNRKKRTK